MSKTQIGPLSHTHTHVSNIGFPEWLPWQQGYDNLAFDMAFIALSVSVLLTVHPPRMHTHSQIRF